MNQMRTTHLLIAGVAAQIVAFSGADADVIEIFEDQPAWESALSSQESIFFTEFPPGTFLWNQYEELGVLFTDGNDFISTCPCPDGSGVDGIDDIYLAFDRPRTAIAMDSPGSRRFQLFYAGELIYTSGWGVPPGGETIFLGLLSDQPFDTVRIYSAGGGVAFIDNLYFGDVIPAPGVMALFGLAAITARCRRRRPVCAYAKHHIEEPPPDERRLK